MWSVEVVTFLSLATVKWRPKAFSVPKFRIKKHTHITLPFSIIIYKKINMKFNNLDLTKDYLKNRKYVSSWVNKLFHRNMFIRSISSLLARGPPVVSLQECISFASSSFYFYSPFLRDKRGKKLYQLRDVSNQRKRSQIPESPPQ